MNDKIPQNQPNQNWVWWIMGIITFFFIIVIFSQNKQTVTPAVTSPVVNNTEENISLNQSTDNQESGTYYPTQKNDCLHTSAIKFSITEESRMKEIMLSVMQRDDMPTLAIYNEFWTIMNRHGKLCEEDIALTKNVFNASAECNKLFYQDALLSLRAGQAYKSPQRLDCENKTIRALLTADKAAARIKTNEESMLKIANGDPIGTATGNIIFTEEIIQATLDDIDAKLERIDMLFATTPPLFSDNTPTQSNEEPSLHITRNPALDKQCEEEHGPSVYKSVPQSLGGGAYCDCKTGYILKPMVDNYGRQSSWCVKE